MTKMPMQKIVLAMSALIFSMFFASVSHAATTGGTLSVSASVPAVCSVSTTAVNFGSVSGATTTAAAGDISVNCSNGTPYNITLDAGQHLTGSSRDVVDATASFSVQYTLYQPDGVTQWGDRGFAGTYTAGNPLPDTGSGAVQPHVVNGSLSTFRLIPAGTSLTDIVNVTINF